MPHVRRRKLFYLWPSPKGNRLLRPGCYHGHVVRAFSIGEARGLVDFGEEGPSFWKDPTLAKCNRLDQSGKPGTILSAYMPPKDPFAEEIY